MIRAFLDANIFVAAAASQQGGSALLLEAAKKHRLEIVSSRLALLEAERNIQKKFPSRVLDRFHRLLREVPLLIVPSPPAEEVRRYHPLIHEKDAPILAAAVSSRADFLVTLDRRDFMSAKLRRASMPLRMVTPREFFRSTSFQRTLM